MVATADGSVTGRGATGPGATGPGGTGPSVTDLAAMQGRSPRIEELVEHAATLTPDARLSRLTDAALERQLVTQTVRVAAETSRWLDLIAEVVVRGIWADHGARSPAAWLSWRLGIAPSTAREHVRVALRLRELPQIHARFGAGTLSYSKVRALTRIAVPELEELLLTWADQATGADLDRIAKGVVQARRAADDDRSHDDEQRAARAGLDVLIGDDGEVELRWRLDAADGMEVLGILDRLVELEDAAEEASMIADAAATTTDAGGSVSAWARPSRSTRQRQGQVLHDLLVAARDTTPPDTSGADRHTLVLQVDAAGLAADLAERPARRVPIEVAGSRRVHPSMSVSVLRRLACDAGVVIVPTGSSRVPIDVGRRRRRPTAALLRALMIRDRSCRFPGCATGRHLHAHHVWHWADGGPTDLANLVLLCGAHHRQIHKPGWQLVRSTGGEVIVRPPGADGRPAPPLVTAPQLPGLDPAARAASMAPGSAIAPSSHHESGPSTGAATIGREAASAEAPDQLTPQHWSDDDPLQIDLLIAILEQELAQTRGEGLAHVA